MRIFKITLVAGGSLALGLVAGLLAGSALSGPMLNSGLVNALNSVGQNLLDPDANGFEVFAARGDVLNGGDVLIVDLANTAAVPIYVNVFHPPDPTFPPGPCGDRATYRVSLQDGMVRVLHDPEALRVLNRDLMPYGDAGDLSDYPPGPCLGTPPTD